MDMSREAGRKTVAKASQKISPDEALETLKPSLCRRSAVDLPIPSGVCEEGNLGAVERSIKLQHRVTSQTDFENGFTVHLSDEKGPIGRFILARDEEGLPNNDVEIQPSRRGGGHGVTLLLLAVWEAESHGFGFEIDSRGISEGQGQVYASAERRGFITEPVMGCVRLTDAGEARLEELGLI